MANPTAKPFLMFQHAECKPALDFYLSIFPDSSRIQEINFYPPDDPSGAPEGLVRMAKATIAGLELLFNDSWIEHAFDFTPSWSLSVSWSTNGCRAAGSSCKDRKENDRTGEKSMASASEKLADGGKVLMPFGDYGFPGVKKFAWVQDKFGVSWQLSLE